MWRRIKFAFRWLYWFIAERPGPNDQLYFDGESDAYDRHVQAGESRRLETKPLLNPDDPGD